MDALQIYYRAFREYREKMASSEEHVQWISSLESADGKAAYNGQMRRCVWDEAWIDAMLEGLPYVEHALEEQRRFIESNAEVRRVDQAKRTTVESVRHLAQHSNLISRIDGEDIIPDKLLIVERDDSYDIYENRFLHTLVLKMQAFLAERYGAVAEINEAEGFALELHRAAAWNRQRLDAQIQLSYERRPARNRNEIDVSEMNAMERVNHLRQRVAQLANAPLMRQLKGVSPLRPPIVRTNVFKKNENFRRALELYEYLQAYRGAGYEIVVDRPEKSAMDEELRKELCEIVALGRFAGQMASSAELRSALEANFLRENELVEQERLRLEAERERKIQARIQAARDAEIEIRKAEVARRDALIQQREEEIAQLSGEVQKLNCVQAELAQEKRRLEECVRERQARVDALEQAVLQQQQARSAAQAQIAQMQARQEADNQAHARECDQLRGELNRQSAQHAATLARQENQLGRMRAEMEAQTRRAEQRTEALRQRLRRASVRVDRLEKQLEHLKNRRGNEEAGILLGLFRKKK